MSNKKQKDFNGYVRPKTTFQDKLTKDMIKEKLQDYIEVEDISTVPLDTHIRYFTEKVENGKKKKLFRMGGFLKNRANYEKYIILTNNKVDWSVDTKKSILFRKMATGELRELMQDELESANDEIVKLKKTVKKLKAENQKLKKQLK
tara:strand:+ start:1104 stop:1544 length:441 start_codon:yes stop_codon:yes gene_type:complete